MRGNKRYVLDANVFIQAKNAYYGFEFCPGFWEALIVENRNDHLCSIDRVRDELVKVSLQKGDDPDRLSKWAKSGVPDTCFKKTREQNILRAFGQMVAWVNAEPQFMPKAKTEFAQVADGWLIAYARIHGLVVVTLEGYSPDARKKVLIPNVCREFDVDYVNTFEMLDDLGVELILNERRRPRE